jgi:hypothetical protein
VALIVIQSMNVQQFIHRFRNGVTVTLTYDIDSFLPGETSHCRAEWSGKPNKRMLPEYLRWKHSVCDKLAVLINGRVMDVMQVAPQCWEAWVHEPGKAGVKVDTIREP